MTSTEIATVQGNALAVEGGQNFWNDHQLAALRQLGVEHASNGDLAVFHHVCQRTGLDPFARQIYLIERQGKQTIQTGIDGFRLVARRAVDRTGETLSIGSAEWCGQDGVWSDVWLKDEPPAAARVTITRGTGTFVAVALFREYAQTKRDGGLTSMWASRSAGQLAKCAEALALRKAFPHDLSGVYSDDEMAREERRHVVEQRASALGQALQTSSPDADVADLPPPGDVAPQQPGEEPRDDMITDAQLRNIGRLMGKSGLNITDRDEALVKVAVILGHEIESRKDLTKDEASRVIDALDAELTAREREGSEA